MRNFKTIFAGIIACLALAVTAPAASAQVQGTYCSAATTDGIWAFSYGNQNVFYSCNTVRNSLAFRTRAPISASSRGYYWLNAFNTVWVNCFNGQTSFSGFGSYPLANAYNYVSYGNGLGCTFAVN